MKFSKFATRTLVAGAAVLASLVVVAAGAYAVQSRKKSRPSRKKDNKDGKSGCDSAAPIESRGEDGAEVAVVGSSNAGANMAWAQATAQFRIGHDGYSDSSYSVLLSVDYSLSNVVTIRHGHFLAVVYRPPRLSFNRRASQLPAPLQDLGERGTRNFRGEVPVQNREVPELAHNSLNQAAVEASTQLRGDGRGENQLKQSTCGQLFTSSVHVGHTAETQSAAWGHPDAYEWCTQAPISYDRSVHYAFPSNAYAANFYGHEYLMNAGQESFGQVPEMGMWVPNAYPGWYAQPAWNAPVYFDPPPVQQVLEPALQVQNSRETQSGQPWPAAPTIPSPPFDAGGAFNPALFVQPHNFIIPSVANNEMPWTNMNVPQEIFVNDFQAYAANNPGNNGVPNSANGIWPFPSVGEQAHAHYQNEFSN